MKLTFLGTGAADWCIREHKKMEGFRRNAALLIDDCLLIDPGPDVPDALAAFGQAAGAIRYVLNTHRHSDHYCPKTLDALPNAAFYPMQAGETLRLGDYEVTALRANHATCTEAVHFIVSRGGKRLFYGLDGAWLTYDEVAAIQACGIDYAVLDATVGDVPGDYRIFEHNNLSMVREMVLSLKGHVRRFCISHMARTLHGSHAELAEAMEPFGIEVSFDGYETEI